MGDFRTYRHARRQPAKAMQPIVAPSAWAPQDLHDVASWSYRLTEEDRAELIEAVRNNRVALEDVSRENFRLDGLKRILIDVRRELLEGRGIVTLQNFPVERLDREGQAIAYLGMGAHIGERISQNRQGHILGHVKD